MSRLVESWRAQSWGVKSDAERIVSAYRAWRKFNKPAREALRQARDMVTWPDKAARPMARRFPEYNRPSERGTAWLENADKALRLVGFADSVSSSIRHFGWYTDSDDCGEVARGLVYRLPKGRGFLAAYQTGESRRGQSWETTCGTGGACVDFSGTYDDESDAARAADSLAESLAESEREYREAWRAGMQAHDLQILIGVKRRKCLQVIRAFKATRDTLAESLREIVCNRVRAMIREIESMREEIAELTDTFGDQPGFSDI